LLDILRKPAAVGASFFGVSGCGLLLGLLVGIIFLSGKKLTFGVVLSCFGCCLMDVEGAVLVCLWACWCGLLGMLRNPWLIVSSAPSLLSSRAIVLLQSRMTPAARRTASAPSSCALPARLHKLMRMHPAANLLSSFAGRSQE
jgi:hypothetical protein